MKYAYLLILLFIALAIFSRALPFFRSDLIIAHSIQTINFPLFDVLMKAVSSIGGGRVMPFAVISLAFFVALLNLKLEAIYLLVSTAGSFYIGTIAKYLISRPRPESNLVHIYKQLTDNSFPSAHTLVYTVVFGFLFYVIYTKIKISPLRQLSLTIAAFLVLTVGLSRIYLGAHWPSDVLGGYLLGFFCLFITINIYKNHVQR